MLGKNQELSTHLLLSFIESMKGLPEKIEILVAAGNWISAKELIHKIKGDPVWNSDSFSMFEILLE